MFLSHFFSTPGFFLVLFSLVHQAKGNVSFSHHLVSVVC